MKGAGVTDIAFGSETGQLEQLEELVTALDQRSREIDELRALEMKRGDSFVRAYRQAVARVIGEKTAALMDEPNNILAMEYLRRIRYWRGQGTTIQAHAVRRFGSGYGDVNRKEGFAGASALEEDDDGRRQGTGGGLCPGQRGLGTLGCRGSSQGRGTGLPAAAKRADEEQRGAAG